MKIVKMSVLLVAAVAVMFGLSTASYAFHDGGVAECMGCHNIHDAASTSALLLARDTTSTCANSSCHGSPSAGSYHILTPQSAMSAGVPPLNHTPAGDFGWLLKTYTWIPRGTAVSSSEGEHHGHNVVALDLAGYVSASSPTVPGGGTGITVDKLSCNSCHDNHGKLRRLSTGAFATTGAPIINSGSYTNSVDPIAGQAVGAYRLLRGPGSSAGDGGKTFGTVFNAVVASTYNKYEGTDGPTAQSFGRGTSDWCATCHPDMLSQTSAKHTHPTNQGLSAAIVSIYNSYMGSGLTGASGFSSLVPFADDNQTNYATLRTNANSGAALQASTSSRVNCLSCHRAHATGWDHMTRWNNEYEMIMMDGVWPGTDSTGKGTTPALAMGRTVAETTAAYNRKATDPKPADWATYQRSLCNKCHGKD